MCKSPLKKHCSRICRGCSTRIRWGWQTKFSSFVIILGLHVLHSKPIKSLADINRLDSSPLQRSDINRHRIANMFQIFFLNASFLMQMEVCCVHFEIAGSPVSNKAHRASPHASATKYQGCLPKSHFCGESCREWSGNQSEAMDAHPCPQHLLLSTFTGKVLLNRSVQGAMLLFFCFWSGLKDDHLGSNTVSVSHMNSVRSKCKGCTSFSPSSFQQLWWQPLIKILALPIQMLCFGLFWFRQHLAQLKNTDLFVIHLQWISNKPNRRVFIQFLVARPTSLS